jgi:hypothetical protein
MAEPEPYLSLTHLLAIPLRYMIAYAPSELSVKAFLWLEFIKRSTHRLNRRDARESATASVDDFHSTVNEVIRNVRAERWQQALKAIEQAAELGPLPVTPPIEKHVPYIFDIPLTGNVISIDHLARGWKGTSELHSANAATGTVRGGHGSPPPSTAASMMGLPGNVKVPDDFNPKYYPLSEKYRRLQEQLKRKPPPPPAEIGKK